MFPPPSDPSTASAPRSADWIEGAVSRVLWVSEQTGYAVIRLRTTDEREIVVVGDLAVIAEAGEGAFAALEGRWEDHPVHGRQFRSSGALQGTPRSLEGIRMYLASSGVKGVGPQLAMRIVDRFGLRTPIVLSDEPHRLTEVEGIGAERAKAISEAWSKEEEGRALTMTLRGLGLPGRLVEQIRRRYGDRAARVVSAEPYRLAEEIRGIGFRTADALARQQGLPPDDPARVRAAISHILDHDASDGHCYLPRHQLARAVADLGVPTTHLDVAVDSAEGAGRVVVEVGDSPADDRIWSAALYQAEVTVARELIRRTSGGEPPGEAGVAGEIERAERYEGVTLHPEQRRAVEAALGGGVVVITGGPGTGKTTLVRVLLRAVRERGGEWLLASPTGRAARRLEEATGQQASTLHRLLEYRPGEGGFQRNFSNPLDGDGLVVDEVSMVDIELMAALVEALPDEGGFSLVLVGDADQLPSVGAGQVLRDLVSSGAVPVVRLQTVHRQGADSGIILAAAEIHAGRVPTSGEKVGRDDTFLLVREDAERARETILDIVADRLPKKGFDPMQDVQVLTPTRRGPLGTEALNTALQARLNPDGPGLKRGERELRVGDRVICVRNRYDVEVFNGDTGLVVDASRKGLVVSFDGREVEWEREELGLLDHAWAITVHKSQGSEYPAVVLALHGVHGIMLRRNLFYTAITRAKRFLCVVGSGRAWYRAVSQVGGDDRYTALGERLSGCRAGPSMDAPST